MRNRKYTKPHHKQLLNTTDEENILKEARGKKVHYLDRKNDFKKIGMATNLTSEIMHQRNNEGLKIKY